MKKIFRWLTYSRPTPNMKWVTAQNPRTIRKLVNLLALGGTVKQM
jgi:hypothetical protein